jgi:hypothetical protein
LFVAAQLRADYHDGEHRVPEVIVKGIRSLLLLVLAAANVWAGSSGISPRAQVSEYPASGRDAQIAIGAKQLSNGQVRDAFVADLNHEYAVVEVAVYPDTGGNVTVTHDQFTLLTRDGKTLQPLQPQQVAEAIAKRKGWDHTSAHPTVGVGMEAGRGRDIYTGTPTPNVYTTTGVTTTIGRRQASIDRIEKDLARKMLPEGTLATPAAGYLLFDRPGGKPSSYELRFKGDTQTVVLIVPVAK